MYTVSIKNKNYSTVCFVPNSANVEPLELSLKDIHRKTRKFYHGDIVDYCSSSKKITVIKTNKPTRSITGAVQITRKVIHGLNNKRFPYYVCTPNDQRLPKCLIALNERGNTAKNNSEYYISFKYTEWKKTLPYASLLGIIGEKGVQKAEIEYRMVSNNLEWEKKDTNNKVTENTSIFDLISLDELIKTHKYRNRIRESDSTVTIDPANSTDNDDALSYRYLGGNKHRVGIHIADVSFWVTQLKLQKYIENQQFTVYGKNRKCNVFPSVFADHLFSLRAGKERLAMSCMVDFRETKDSEFIMCKSFFEKTIIKTGRNLSYDQAEKAVESRHGGKMIKTLRALSSISSSIFTDLADYKEDNMHTCVAKFMILCNSLAADRFVQENHPFIARTNLATESPLSKDSSNEKVNRFLGYYRASKSCYKMYDPDVNTAQFRHNALDINYYAHFTSPIRRVVDIYNHYYMREILGEKPQRFTVNIDKINKMSKNTQKLHREFKTIMDMCKHDGIVSGTIYTGYLIDYDENYMKIYFPECDYLHSKRIISPKLGSWATVEADVSQLSVSANDNKVSIARNGKMKGKFALRKGKIVFDFDIISRLKNDNKRIKKYNKI